MKTLPLLVLLSLVVTGCSSVVVPVVSDIRDDGHGNLIVEKTTVVIKPWSDKVYKGTESTTNIVLLNPQTAAKRP